MPVILNHFACLFFSGMSWLGHIVKSNVNLKSNAHLSCHKNMSWLYYIYGQFSHQSMKNKTPILHSMSLKGLKTLS